MLRRTLWRWTIAATAVIATITAVPTTASAATGFAAPRCGSDTTPGDFVCMPQYEPATASLKHVGWTYLNLNYCAPGRLCAAIYRDSMAAWSWNGRSWTQASLRQGWVYVYPYTGEWRWAWTQSTGWVAVSGGRFELRGY